MPKTLYAKLAVGLFVLLAAIGLLYGLLAMSATRHYLEEVNQRLNRDLARNLVADRNLVAKGRIDEKALESMFHDYMTINPSIEIYLLDLQGNILSYSAEPGQVKRKSVSLGPIREFMSGKAKFPLLGDDPRSHDRRKTFSVTPVPSAAHPEGWLYVVLRSERFDDVDALLAQSHITRASAAALAGSLVAGLLAGLVLFHLLTRRLRRLTGLIDAFRASGFERHEAYAAPGGARDEIDQLGRAYDEMADRITDQIRALESQDAHRRELVAHVSHDLRTPLASLHGYLETMKLKDGSLDPRDRERYLDAALRHSERLAHLVGELFELAKLDARETPAECEPFAAAELVQDIVQKFELRAERGGARLHMQVDGEVPLASGDIALVERLLENLIDNALEHTPRGGEVRIPVRGEDGRVSISVCDTGEGIPPDELPRIFDRFYRAGNAHRGTESGAHAGLGLAIAKRIAELHGSELRVRSTVGRGTTFSFRLEAAARGAPAA